MNLDKINSMLKDIDCRLSISYDLEDIYGQDYEEYGIVDIEDTRHYSLLVSECDSSSVIVKKYFSFDSPRTLLLVVDDYSCNLLKSLGFSIVEISKIEKVLLSFSSNVLR